MQTDICICTAETRACPQNDKIEMLIQTRNVYTNNQQVISLKF